MTIQNLAIVVAPNLYDVSSVDPMEGLVMSQKVVQVCLFAAKSIKFLQNLLQWYAENRNTNGKAPSKHRSNRKASQKKSHRRRSVTTDPQQAGHRGEREAGEEGIRKKGS